MVLTQEIISEKLLWGLWRSIDESYKERYFIDVWEHFENAIKSASYTNSLKKFLSNIKSRLPVTIQAQFNEGIISVVELGQDEIILDWLRTETAYLIMICRVKNQERQEGYKK